jgi:RNA polymerase sigma-70 factor (ECF subfamily)
MDSPQDTRASLLVRLRDTRDGEAWSQFVDIYVPLIYGYARKRGLQDADAADVTQEVLRTVSQSLRHWDYDPQIGTFRGWLLRVVRTMLRRHAERRNRPGRGSGGSDVHELLAAHAPPETGDDPDWDQDYARRVFEWAAGQVRGDVQESTWLAFHRTAVGGVSAQQVAADLGLSVAAVYLARSRVMERLRSLVRTLQLE